MPLTEKEREVTLTVLHRFLNLNEPSPHKLLVRQCKDPKIIEHLMRVGILGSYSGEPVAYLPRPIAFHYCGDAEALRRAKSAVTITIKILQNLFEVEVEKDNFTPDDVLAHARKIYAFPPSIDEIKLGLFLIADFPNVLKVCGFNSSHTEMASLQFNDNILALDDIDGMWDRHLLYQSRFLEKEPDLSEDNEDGMETITVPELLKTPAANSALLVFISHSSKDAEIARALIDLLRASLGLRADQIRCSSVDGYRLPVGINTEDQLRDEVNAAKAVIGLVTPSSLRSSYVMFELGARWGSRSFIAPLLASVPAGELHGPLSLLNALSANNEAQLHQLVENIGNQLGLQPQSSSSYVRHISTVKSLAAAVIRVDGFQPEKVQDAAMSIELTPGRGQGEHMFLIVKNLGQKQTFRAQCRVLGRRNDPNPEPVSMFDLNWQYGGRDLYLARGQEGNILIASAGEDKSRGLEWMKLETTHGQHAPDSHWNFGTQLLPEYDLEITVLGNKSEHPQSERFTVRPGKSCALEMYRPLIQIK
jgi:hypothetical protein